MKKVMSLLLMVMIVLSLSACGVNETATDNDTVSSTTQNQTDVTDTGSTEQSTDTPNTTTKPSTPAHTHSYSGATCTAPAKCSCGETEGEALGHSFNNGVCSRCGFVKFETLKFSGSNQGIVAENINLPEGQYRVLISFEGTDAYMVEKHDGGWLNVDLQGDSYEKSFSSVDSGSAKATIIDGPVNNGYILIDGHKGNWQITIEAFK